MEGAVFGAGNPLLDISAEVDDDVLHRYGLLPGNAILAEEKHVALYNELMEMADVSYIAGGATQNSIRVCQWMLQKPYSTTFLGSVGGDIFSEKLEAAANKDNVRVEYMHVATHPTGRCAVCVVGKERSLVADLGAACQFELSYMRSPKVMPLLEKAQVFYIGAFFLTSSPESAQFVAQYATEARKPFCMNLSAVFLIEQFSDWFDNNMPCIDVLFGNEDEGKAFGRRKGWGEKLTSIAANISQYEKKNANKARIVVFTQGKKPTIVAEGGKTREFEVPLLDQDKVVDTNGAGDAFVGGFLSGFVRGAGIEECIRAGHYASSVIIQHSGCSFPSKPEF